MSIPKSDDLVYRLKIGKDKNPKEIHPYGMFIPKQLSSLIVGSFTTGKFTNPSRRGEIDFENEIDFNYGGAKNQLWSLLQICFNKQLNSPKTIQMFLTENRMGLADVIILPSPSGQGLRGLGNTKEFKKWRQANPNGNAGQYRMDFYRKVFTHF